MSVLGSQFKINIYVEPIHKGSSSEVHLDSCDFNCIFFTSPNKYVELKKSQMVKIDKDNYVALIDSESLGVGTIKMTMEIDIPDPLFENNTRKEINTINTGIKIYPRDVQN